ncbi:PrsW family intramembrane metalloprotease [Streptomyces pactum]|uniref:PrsW family intramembrane metalloprotease n=1 Tax=Streptomyces pactum TaxID=68249 RepID=A0ABS0NM26_9ACTN|nr:PrsW family intramembrane metalloprotease [Streptomyces pactum]
MGVADQPAGPPVPAYSPQPRFDAVPEPAGWRYRPRRAVWESRALRATALVLVLSLCGLIILALVRKQTGTEGFLVGLGLSVLPVPLLVAAFRWLDRVEPKPWRNLVFAFAWGACAATLVALIANGFATEWLVTNIAESSAAEESADADAWGATLVAPVVEESAKAGALLFLFLFRRRDFNGILDGLVIAGIAATGFAFTENILYLGSAFVSDQEFGHSGLRSTTAATFFVRVIMSPFAHPLFTAMTGIGFGLAAAATHRQRVRRVLLPIAGLLAAMVLHGLWNGSAILGSGAGFMAVYLLFMVPAFGLLVWLAVWSRNHELRTIRAYLPVYQAAGWLTAPEPVALSSFRARGIARDVARRVHGPAAARTVAEYTAFATSLAFLRSRAYRDTPGPDFTAREQELLHHLWQRKDVARPILAHAALLPPAPRRRPYPVRPPYPGAWPYGPYAHPGPYAAHPHAHAGPYPTPSRARTPMPTPACTPPTPGTPPTLTHPYPAGAYGPAPYPPGTYGPAPHPAPGPLTPPGTPGPDPVAPPDTGTPPTAPGTSAPPP